MMKKIYYVNFMSTLLLLVVMQANQLSAQAPPPGKYDTTNYPEDRKFINSISNIFDASLSLNDNSISIGADGSIAYGLEEEFQKFERNGMTVKSVETIPGTELLRAY